MKYGMNLLLWTGDVTEAHRPVLEMLKKLGYDGVELPVFDLNPDKFAIVGKWLDELDLERTAVTVRTKDDNPISPDPAVRAKGVAQNKRALECCQAAGATILCGPYHSALGEFSGTGRTADEWTWGVESMRAVAEHASKCGVRLAVEYLNRFECYFLNNALDTARFCQEVNHPACRMMYDTFHANLEEKCLATAIRTCAPWTIHVHISENDRSTPGQGHIHWDLTYDTLKQTGYDGYLMVEAFGLALPELAAATKIWRRMFESEFQLSADALWFMKSQWAKRSAK